MYFYLKAVLSSLITSENTRKLTTKSLIYGRNFENISLTDSTATVLISSKIVSPIR